MSHTKATSRMAAWRWIQLTVDWYGARTDIVNISDWPNSQDSHEEESSFCCWVTRTPSFESDHRKRSKIVHAIIHNRRLDHLETILGSGWDVNETLTIPEHKFVSRHFLLCYQQRTILGEAVRKGWTEGAKMVIDAGAKCNTSGEAEKPLMLALQYLGWHPDLMELLLKHGADPNDHDGRSDHIPLLFAINRCRYDKNAPKTVALLLEYGANPNVSGVGDFGKKDCPLSAAVQKSLEVFAVVIKILLHYGSDVHYIVNEVTPLLHVMTVGAPSPRGHCMFLREALDLFFLHGGNIDMLDGEDRTALEYAVMENSNSNTIRWLIRHGADTSLMDIALLKEHFQAAYNLHCFPVTPVILLQAGMRIPYAAQTLLSNMEIAVSAWLQDESQCCSTMCKKVEAMRDQLDAGEKRQLQRKQQSLQEFSDESLYVFPEIPLKRTCWTAMSRRVQAMRNQLHRADRGELDRKQQYFRTLASSQQAEDLQEFSDESLHFYRELPVIRIKNRTQRWLELYDYIHSVLEFLSQPQSLQWHCRCSIRESLVSLQPSAVKTLPIPGRLKRFILCHEI